MLPLVHHVESVGLTNRQPKCRIRSLRRRSRVNPWWTLSYRIRATFSPQSLKSQNDCCLEFGTSNAITDSVGVTAHQYARFMGSTTETGPNGALLKASKVKERGWTDSLIRRFLDPPDATAPNPMYRSAARVRLYDLTRILNMEARPEWQAAKVVASRRSAVSSRASTRRASDVVELAGRFIVTLPVLSDETLYRLAVDHRKKLMNNRDDFENATMEGVDEWTLR